MTPSPPLDAAQFVILRDQLNRVSDALRMAALVLENCAVRDNDDGEKTRLRGLVARFRTLLMEVDESALKTAGEEPLIG